MRKRNKIILWSPGYQMSCQLCCNDIFLIALVKYYISLVLFSQWSMHSAQWTMCNSQCKTNIVWSLIFFGRSRFFRSKVLGFTNLSVKLFGGSIFGWSNFFWRSKVLEGGHFWLVEIFEMSKILGVNFWRVIFFLEVKRF